MGDFDITKLTITVRDLGLSGYQASQILNNKYHIQVEMADPFNVLVIVSIGDRRDDLNRLVDALRDMSKEYHGKPSQSSFIAEVSLPPFGKAGQMTPREAFFRDYRYAPLDESGGLISSEIITVYPRHPLLVPGEIVTQEVIDYIRKMDRLGATVDGLNASNSTIAVVKQ